MITIDLGTVEYYDEAKSEFIYDEGGIVRFEYSLKAIYNWEAKWKKRFLEGMANGLNEDELLDFYMKMALDPIEERFLTTAVANVLAEYINDPNTATTFSTFEDGQNGNQGPKKYPSAEEIYASMISANVPLDFENRNMNRLSVILRIISLQQSPPKKMTKHDIMRQNAELNKQRRAQLKSKG